MYSKFYGVMRSVIYVIFFAVTVCSAKTWNLKDESTITGQLLKYNNGTVIIKQDSGGMVMNSIDNFSAEDQALIRERFPDGDKPPEAAKPKVSAPKPSVNASSRPGSQAKLPSSTLDRNIPIDVVNQRPEREIGDTPFRAYNLNKSDPAFPLSGRVQGSYERVRLDELRGKLVLIQVWSYANKYSVNHTPYLAKLYEKYHAKGFEIIGVHVPTDGASYRAKPINDAEESLGVVWPVNNDSKFVIAKRWGFQNIPTYTLIDGNGLILYPGVEISDLETVIRTYLRLDP